MSLVGLGCISLGSLGIGVDMGFCGFLDVVCMVDGGVGVSFRLFF